MKDLYNHIVPVQVVAPVNVLDATVPAAVEVDLAGWNSAVIEVSHGAKVVGDTGTITLKLEHADDSVVPGVAGTYAEVEAVDMQGVTPAAGTGIILTLAAGAVAAAIHKLGYIGGKRHLKFTVAETDANATGTIMAISLIKGHGLDVPAI
ncbi:MAG: hypothetical protein ACYDHW_10820 [Syntrophorhabdaceae bacterium]